MRVLLVDTNPEDIEQVRIVTKHIPEMELQVVADLQSMRRALESREYLTVVADYSVEGGTGQEIISAIKEIIPEIPIVLLAANIDEQDAIEFLEFGATDYVLKRVLSKLPFTLKRIYREQKKREHNRLLGLSIHDIMSPVTAIDGYLELMKGHLNTEDEAFYVLHGYSEKIKKGVQDIGAILEQLRAINKNGIENSYVALDVDLNWVAADVCEIMKGSAEAKGHDLVLVQNHLPVHVSVDIQHLKRILYNFISNAIRYTPKAGRIEIHVDEIDAMGCVTVTDNGIGIPEDKLDYIFRLNAKLNKEDLYNNRSTGIGLYVNSTLARQIGGEITVESVPGEGSSFTIKIPLCTLSMNGQLL
jgi:signal transduction histidine kinase